MFGKLSSGAAQEVDREIDATGYVRTSLVDRASRFTNQDRNELSHDRAGLLSVPKGGGSFEFAITPGANVLLDRDRIVIGEVITGLETVAAINSVPVRRPSNENEVGSLIYSLGACERRPVSIPGPAALGRTLCLAAAAAVAALSVPCAHR